MILIFLQLNNTESIEQKIVSDSTDMKNEQLGTFDIFDRSSSAVKEIRVQLLKDKDVKKNPDGSGEFYVADRNDYVVLVSADRLPKNISTKSVIILRGHLNYDDKFHAHDILVE